MSEEESYNYVRSTLKEERMLPFTSHEIEILKSAGSRGLGLRVFAGNQPPEQQPAADILEQFTERIAGAVNNP